ncbi:MAG: inositol monophosphatase [Porphyromonadaceae bacterium CG2_30_38_12]|nr:MAG: inositol monophosphatase [Porphyromonadaceae bacterium CG2_30_38_12]
MTYSYQELTLQTIEIAKQAGRFMADERKSFDESKIEFKGAHDLVSYVDKASEKLIVNYLQQLLPESGFIAEEGTSAKHGEHFNWVIDPLDGTTNYIQGLPIYAVSIGLLHDDKLVLGVVYEVGHDECFYAWKNGGAFLNNKPIQVSKRSNIDDCLIATGFPYCDFSGMENYLKTLSWAMTSARGVRRLGSAATDLAYVACGRFDAFWEYDLKPWDVAAGAIIIQEAGGKVTDYTGGKNYIFGREILATNDLVEISISNV